jgi:hypothetical protein
MARLHHVGYGAHGVLDRHARIEARRPVDVDMIETEALQRIGEKIPHRRRPRVVAQPAAGGITQRAELDADEKAVALHALQRLADQHLIMAHAVEIAGVDERDAGIERGVDRGDALRAVGRAIHARHAHAAEADGGNRGTMRPEKPMLHVGSFLTPGSGGRRPPAAAIYADGRRRKLRQFGGKFR